MKELCDTPLNYLTPAEKDSIMLSLRQGFDPRTGHKLSFSRDLLSELTKVLQRGQTVYTTQQLMGSLPGEQLPPPAHQTQPVPAMAAPQAYYQPNPPQAPPVERQPSPYARQVQNVVQPVTIDPTSPPRLPQEPPISQSQQSEHVTRHHDHSQSVSPQMIPAKRHPSPHQISLRLGGC
jgi:hypothetical protein